MAKSEGLSVLDKIKRALDPDFWDPFANREQQQAEAEAKRMPDSFKKAAGKAGYGVIGRSGKWNELTTSEKAQWHGGVDDDKVQKLWDYLYK